MANKRIKDLAEKSSFVSGDYFPIDNSNGTKKVNASKIMTPLSNVQGEVSGSSDAYKTTKAYKVGDVVIYNNTLYQCTTACSAGSWSANRNCFTATTLATAVTQLNNELTPNKITITASTKFSDVSSYIDNAISKGRHPFIYAPSFTIGGNTFNKIILVYTHSGYGTISGCQFHWLPDSYTNGSIEIGTSNTVSNATTFPSTLYLYL